MWKNKMKKINFFALFSFIICACSQSTFPSNQDLETTFALTDTLGQTASQFHRGEEFRLSYILTNNTKDTLTYYRGNSGPSIIFQIQKNDSVIASSVDGYAFAMIAFTSQLAPGHSLKEDWIAPTTPVQYPKVVLDPGQYRAMVSYPNFKQAKVDTVFPILFTVFE